MSYSINNAHSLTDGISGLERFPTTKTQLFYIQGPFYILLLTTNEHKAYNKTLVEIALNSVHHCTICSKYSLGVCKQP